MEKVKKDGREMQIFQIDEGSKFYLPVSLDGMEYLKGKSIIFHGIVKETDIDIGSYNDKVMSLFPVFCSYAEDKNGKSVGVSTELYKLMTPAEMEELFKILHNMWGDSRKTKKKSPMKSKGT